MKLQFKHQQFQEDASNAVCDIFTGQPMTKMSRYILDPGADFGQLDMQEDAFANTQLAMSRNEVWDAVHKKQVALGLKPSGGANDDINLTIEMETGTGKTYTYIKTMYELNKRYGWSKFIIVVPSIAIREGVKKSFEITLDNFKQEYGQSIIPFIYNSGNLTDIKTFATDNKIRVMIINAQAFASSLKQDGRSKESRIIFNNQDSFGGRKPIDVISRINPILILDEPQSLGRTEESAIQKSLKLFNSLFTLRYSATPPELNKNIIYRLDAQDAYDQKLVKKISVKGISVSGNTATGGYVYLSRLNLSDKAAPKAVIEFDIKGKDKTTRTTRVCNEEDNLYNLSKELAEYKDGWIITKINGTGAGYVDFMNGKRIAPGEVLGNVSEDHMRRIQIREAIKSHIEREQKLFTRGIKVLTLFFIDEVEKYRLSDDGTDANGIYAKMFEEEYNFAIEEYKGLLDLEPYYKNFLKGTSAETAHKGYFSIDKQSGKFKNSETKRRETVSDDFDAYDLIMKNKERLLDMHEPVRFIFSHSALREGWDNPNVFQICTLKQSTNDISRRQEIGRGLRLCVNQNGERQDKGALGEAVHETNILTVIASESYEKFVDGLQKDMADTLNDRPRIVSVDLFKIQYPEDAQKIYNAFVKNDYIDDNGNLTEKYHSDADNCTLIVPEGFEPTAIKSIVDTIYKPLPIDNALSNTIDIKCKIERLNSKEFQNLWRQINVKSAYSVAFDTDELITKSISALNKDLRVSKIIAIIKTGTMNEIGSKRNLENRTAFATGTEHRETIKSSGTYRISYDLLGDIVRGTGLTRKSVAAILSKINPDVFAQFGDNPEEFILRTTNIINDQKGSIVIEGIVYNRLDSNYNTDIFTDAQLKGRIDNTVATPNHNVYSHALIDSDIEKRMAEALDIADTVAVYTKLPSKFYISTPVGNYNPDWAISFTEGSMKYIYFIAETKGKMQSLGFDKYRIDEKEKSKIACARKHFKSISSDVLNYDVVESFDDLLNKVMK